jgi:hypothetical protein
MAYFFTIFLSKVEDFFLTNIWLTLYHLQKALKGCKQFSLMGMQESMTSNEFSCKQYQFVLVKVVQRQT